jgi:hypothetical protein
MSDLVLMVWISWLDVYNSLLFTTNSNTGLFEMIVRALSYTEHLR